MLLGRQRAGRWQQRLVWLEIGAGPAGRLVEGVAVELVAGARLQQSARRPEARRGEAGLSSALVGIGERDDLLLRRGRSWRWGLGAFKVRHGERVGTRRMSFY